MCSSLASKGTHIRYPQGLGEDIQKRNDFLSSSIFATCEGAAGRLLRRNISATLAAAERSASSFYLFPSTSASYSHQSTHHCLISSFLTLTESS